MRWREWLLAVSVCSATTGPVAAVELSATAADLALQPGESAVVAVLATASANRALSGLKLDHFAPEDVEVKTLEEPPESTLSAGASAVWVHRLTRVDDGARLGPVLWRLRGTENGGARSAPVVATALTKVGPGAAAAAVASLELKAGFETFRDLRGATVFLLVANTSGATLRVPRVRVHNPDFMVIEPAEPKTFPLLVPPRSSRSIAYHLEARAVEPGTHTLLWEVDLEWSDRERPQQGTLVISKDVKVGMLGESELLAPLKIPSLLLLPGILMVLTFQWLRKHVRPKPSEDQPLSLETVDFLFLAATLSLVAVFVYPRLTAWLLDEPRGDFVVLAGFRDIVNLWWGSVAVGFLAWVARYGVWPFLRRAIAWVQLRLGRAIAWAQLRRLPREGDPPLRVLNELRDERDLLFRRLSFDDDGSRKVGLDLFTRNGRRWLAPGIEIQATAEAEDEVRQASRRSPGELLDALQKTGSKAEWADVKGWIGGLRVLPSEIAVEPVGGNSLYQLVERFEPLRAGEREWAPP